MVNLLITLSTCFVVLNFYLVTVYMLVFQVDMFLTIGFAGYFDATLYRDVHLGIEPSTATPNMFSWY